MKLNVYNQAGEATGTLELNSAIFGRVEIKPEVVHQVVTAMLSNRRNVVASTKTRAEVRGGGKKPWQQKGTGRARAGSIRSPLWRGGGITFGPRANRNFEKKLNKKMKLVGLFSVLSDKVKAEKLFVIDNLEVAIKTRDLAKALQDLATKLPAVGRKITLVIAPTQKNLLVSGRNLPNLRINVAPSLNILDLIASDSIIVLQDALPIIEATYKKN